MCSKSICGDPRAVTSFQRSTFELTANNFANDHPMHKMKKITVLLKTLFKVRRNISDVKKRAKGLYTKVSTAGGMSRDAHDQRHNSKAKCQEQKTELVTLLQALK